MKSFKHFGLLAFCAAGLQIQTNAADMNYKKALQMSNYFFQCQESGELSPGNRCSWRGPAHTQDGKDVNKDLSGGWYDAGDHWKANKTMADAATKLAWSAIEFPQAYSQTGQTDKLLNNLRYICDYFLKTISDASPEDTSDFDSYEVYIDVGGSPGPEPGVHSNWASPEVIEGFTVREALKATNQYPAADVEPLMAAALATSALAFNSLGTADDKQYAEKLLTVSRKLNLHTDKYFQNFFSNTLSQGNVLAVAPDGNARKIGYRDNDPYGATILGFVWQHNAEKSLNGSNYDGRFGKLAAVYEQKMHADGGNQYAWWSGPSSKYSMFALLTSDINVSAEAKQRMEKAINSMLDVWVETNPGDPNGVVVSPGGLHYRKNATNAFTLSRMLNPSTLAIFDAKRRTAKKEVYYNYLKSQADYILGDNPLEKSYMIGFDNDGTGKYQTVVHHRGAYGGWRSFEHFVSSKPFFRPKEVRHILYGGVLLGNDAPEDAFKDEVMHYRHTEVALYANANFQAILAGLIADGMGSGDPVPENSFPPEVNRNENTDLYTTDREFFVITKQIEKTGKSVKIEAELHNRTRWPARRTGNMSFRYYFSTDGGASAEDYTAEIISSNVPSEITGPVINNNCDPYVEISFPENTIAPFVAGNCTQWCNYHKATIKINAVGDNSWDDSNDWSGQGLDNEQAIIPNFPVYQNGNHVGGSQPECEPTTRLVDAKKLVNYNSIIQTRDNAIVITGAQPSSRVEIYGLNGKLMESGITNASGEYKTTELGNHRGVLMIRLVDSRGRHQKPVMHFQAP